MMFINGCKYLFVLAILFFSVHAQKDTQMLLVDVMYKALMEGNDHNVVRVSLIIPCHPVHAPYLYALLKELEKQSMLPDEVIISLSEYEKVPIEIMEELEQARWNFPVTLILSKEALYAGQNRNVASLRATGEVFAYQDADDIPYRSRIEIIKYLFHMYEFDHLMHKFIIIKSQEQIDNNHQRLVAYLRPFDYESQVPGKHMTNGNIAISKKLFDTHQWPTTGPGEDEAYNRKLYKLYENRLLVHNVLLAYRQYLSAGYNRQFNQIGEDDTNKPYQTKIIFNA